jgi:predicted Zn-dependent peptidase
MSIVLDELNKLKSGQISDEEMSRAKNILKVELLEHLEDPENRLQEIARNF